MGCYPREAFRMGVVPITLSCVGSHIPALLQSAYQRWEQCPETRLVSALVFPPVGFAVTALPTVKWGWHREMSELSPSGRLPPSFVGEIRPRSVPPSGNGEGFPLETFSCFDTSVFSLLLEVGQKYTPLGHRDHTCIVNSKLGSVVGLLEGAGHAGFQSMKSAQHQKEKWQNFYVYEQVLVFGSFLPFYKEISICYKWGI